MGALNALLPHQPEYPPGVCTALPILIPWGVVFDSVRVAVLVERSEVISSVLVDDAMLVAALELVGTSELVVSGLPVAELALLELVLVEWQDVAGRSVLVETPAVVASMVLGEDVMVSILGLVEATAVVVTEILVAALVLLKVDAPSECLR